MNAIKVEGVTKYFKIYKEHAPTLKERFLGRKNKVQVYTALKDVSIDIQKGETVGLLGRNGSGKSTLLKMMTGILFPDAGSIKVEGKVSSLLELGAGFHPDFTGRENIFMNASILGLSKREIKQKLNDIISFSELKEYIENPVRNYSSGMYMRLAFSVAIMVEPDVLLIDEVLAVGDSAFQQKCMDQLLKLKSRGTTIVFVSHDLGAMEKLCDRVVWINNSQIQDVGKPRKIIDKYLAYLSEQENNRLINEANSDYSVSNNEFNMISELTEDNSISTQLYRNEADQADRWGNRYIEITNVNFEDNAGNKKLGFMSGDSMVIKIEYKTNRLVRNPVFGIGIATVDGIHCYGTNTWIDEFKLDKLDEGITGIISFNIPSLDLVAATYLTSVAAHDVNGNQYDYHDKKYSFKVSSLINDVGIAKIKHTWSKG